MKVMYCFFAFVKSPFVCQYENLSLRNIALRISISYPRVGSQEPLIWFIVIDSFV